MQSRGGRRWIQVFLGDREQILRKILLSVWKKLLPLTKKIRFRK